MNRDNTFRQVMWVVGGMVALFLVCTTVLMVMDKDITPFLTVGNMVIMPLLGLLGVKAYQTVSSKMDNIEQQVNGRMTTLIDHAKNSVPLDQLDKVETKQ